MSSYTDAERHTGLENTVWQVSRRAERDTREKAEKEMGKRGRDRHTDGQTDGQRDRERQGEVDRQRKQTDRQTEADRSVCLSVDALRLHCPPVSRSSTTNVKTR